MIMGDWRPGDRPARQDREKRYYFLKLTAGFFKDKSIKKLRRMAGGDTYALITLEIFLEALENDNRLYYDGIEKSFAEELALAIDEAAEDVKIAVDFLLSNGWLVEESIDTYYTPKGAEMSGSISARTLRRYKAKEKEELDKMTTECPQLSARCPTYRYRDRARDRERTRGSAEGDFRNLPLHELYPEAFDPRKDKAIPTLSEVVEYAQKNGIRLVNPGLFFSTFSEADWKSDDKDITDWKSLLIALELEELSAGSGVQE